MSVRVVPDTTVIVAHLLGRRTASAQIVRMWREGALEFGMSRALVGEIRSIIGKPYIQRQCRVPREQIEALLGELRERSTYVEEIPRVDVVKSDPSDNVLIATALATDARYVISNDKHLLLVWGHENVEVVRPPELLRRL